MDSLTPELDNSEYLHKLVKDFENSKKVIISDNDILNWMDEKNTIVEHINSLNYNSLRDMYNDCQKSLKYHKELGDSVITPFNRKESSIINDLTYELEYIKKSLDYHKENISREQYGLLNDFANILYFHNHRNTDKENNRFDSQYWADLLDNNNISWSLQNTVSALADNYENKGKYLSTHLKKEGVVSHECSYDELIQKRGEELKKHYLENKEDSVEASASKKRNKLK